MKLRPVKYSPAYAALLAAAQAREAAQALRTRMAEDAYREAKAAGRNAGEAATLAALSVHVPKAPRG